MKTTTPKTEPLELWCKNLKNIATGLEMYAADHIGRYPTTLNELVPKYMTRIPRGPAGEDYFYTAFRNKQPQDKYDIMKFVVACPDEHKPGEAGYPRFESDQGIVFHS